jgi:hypothetical protein
MTEPSGRAVLNITKSLGVSDEIADPRRFLFFDLNLKYIYLQQQVRYLFLVFVLIKIFTPSIPDGSLPPQHAYPRSEFFIKLRPRPLALHLPIRPYTRDPS